MPLEQMEVLVAVAEIQVLVVLVQVIHQALHQVKVTTEVVLVTAAEAQVAVEVEVEQVLLVMLEKQLVQV
jgi:hypothetical protein